MKEQYSRTISPKVSVIVPAYNAGAFLAPCLDSLAAQTLRDIEIIVVDDGSSDATLAIAQRYASKHAHFKVVTQRNAGVSAARNAGLALARGEFIAFVDADDIVEPVMYERMYALAKVGRLDVAVCNAWFIEDGLPASRCFPTLPEGVSRGDNWLVQQVERRVMKHYIWCHLYRRDFLLREEFAFVPGLVHQDIVWTNQVMLAAKRVACIDEPLYHYRHRPGSLSKPRDSAKRLNAALHYLNVVVVLDELARRSNLPGEVREALRFQAADEGLGIFHIAEKLDRPDRLFLFETLLRFDFSSMLSRNAATPTQKRRAFRRCAALQAVLGVERLRERLFGLHRSTHVEEMAGQPGSD
jgi:heptose III glucuronosyltransferase